MRIVYLHQHFTTPDMIGGTRSYEMAKRLAAMGHEVQVVTADRSPGAKKSGGWRTTTEAGLLVHWLPVEYSNGMNVRSRVKSFVRFAIAATQRTAQLPADVVFATSAPLTIAIPALATRLLRKVPYVFEVRDLWPETPIAMGALTNPGMIFAARRLEAAAYKHAAAVIALSPEMKAGVVGAGVAANRVTVIPNSCDFDLFASAPSAGEEFRRRHDWLKDRPLIAYTGTIGRVNGVGYLAHVAALAWETLPQLRFLVVGDGGERDSVRKLAQSLGVLGRNLFMLPAVAKREVPAIMSATDIATSFTIDAPALWANSANKVFDALAAGKPIAINHEGWLADLVRRHAAGLVLPARDHRAAAGMLSAAANRQWCEHAGRAARRLGREQFDREVLAKRLEAVLLQAAGQAASSPIASPALAKAA